MKRITVLFFLLSLAPTYVGFARGDHLEPARSHDSPNGSVRDYYVKVLSLLRTDFNSKPLARCVVLPSFTAEYAWSLERSPDGVSLLTNMLSENFWYARNKNVTVTSRKILLEAELAEAAEELFRAAVAETRPPLEGYYGCDGTTWTFAVDDGNGSLKEGEVWSPPRGSLMRRLTDVCDAFFALPEGKGPSQAELAAGMRALTADIRAQAGVFPWLGNGVRGLLERRFQNP